MERYRIELDTLDPDAYDKMFELWEELQERFASNESGSRFSYAVRCYRYDGSFDYPMHLDEEEES